MNTTSRDFFEHMYESSPDPWSFASSDYERQRYARILDFVPPRCFRNVFEPGCSIGELTALLATRCGFVMAIDIAEAAVAAARQRCHSFDNVDVQQGAVLDELPDGPFDLVVFSEIGYYLTETQLVGLAPELAGRIEASGQLLAVHWTGVSADHLLSGTRVHELLAEHLGMDHLHHEQRSWDDRDGFVLDIWHNEPIPSGRQK